MYEVMHRLHTIAEVARRASVRVRETKPCREVLGLVVVERAAFLQLAVTAGPGL